MAFSTNRSCHFCTPPPRGAGGHGGGVQESCGQPATCQVLCHFSLFTVLHWEVIFIFLSFTLFFCPCLWALIRHSWYWVTGSFCLKLGVTRLSSSALCSVCPGTDVSSTGKRPWPSLAWLSTPRTTEQGAAFPGRGRAYSERLMSFSKFFQHVGWGVISNLAYLRCVSTLVRLLEDSSMGQDFQEDNAINCRHMENLTWSVFQLRVLWLPMA